MELSELEIDFLDLFNYKKRAHLGKYVHLYRPDIYDQVVVSDSYYLYKIERVIIDKYADRILADLKEVSHVIELGPGSDSPVRAKTLPVLQALEKYACIKQYSAVDMTKEYALGACEIVKNNFEHIETRAVVADFVSNGFATSELANCSSLGGLDRLGRVVFCFGGTIFCNSNDHDIDSAIKNIGQLLKKDEYFIFGLDISDNESSLSIAYNNELVRELLLNTMHGMEEALDMANFDASAFDLIYEWDAQSKNVVLHLSANKSQKITINNQEILINKNDKYNIINSRKSCINNARAILAKHNIKIVDSFICEDAFGNKFAIIKSQKY